MSANGVKLALDMNGQEPLLRIPPFPGAKVHSLVRPRPNSVDPPTKAEIDRMADAVQELQVDGEYWLGGSGRPNLENRIRAEVTAFEHIDPFNGEAMQFDEAVRLCGFWRELIDSNRDIGSAVGFAFWKRPTVAPLLWDGRADVRFVSRLKDIDRSRPVAVWKARTPAALLAELESTDLDLIEVEDGFIRSAGLGADCVPPLSIVVDRLGAHFDPSTPSDLENLIEKGNFSDELLERADRLRHLIVASGVSKYGAAASAQSHRRAERQIVLVPGQVEDDRAILAGAGEVRTNLELLRRVRERRPEAHIIYKPHPDVEAGHRIGGAADRECLDFADEIIRDEAIGSLIDQADEIHVISSLAGFEALIRGKPVSTYGVPFYAGWGLTHDLGPVPSRRSAKRSLEELIAAVLLSYPRYLDPVTGLPCPPEVLIRRLAEPAAERPGIVVQLRRLQGRWKRAANAGRG
jgi:capsular polysaccharide export protein